MNAQELHQNLANFYGSEEATLYCVSGNIPFAFNSPNFGKLNIAYTEGMKYLFENGSCYWLLDLIASRMPDIVRDERCEQFHIWQISKKQTDSVLFYRCDRSEMSKFIKNTPPENVIELAGFKHRLRVANEALTAIPFNEVTVTCREDTDVKPVFSTDISVSDFPFEVDYFEFYGAVTTIDDDTNVIMLMLKSEY